MRTKAATGRLGEKLAQDFLRSHGYQILTTNYRSPEGELDIIAAKGGVLVFVEVRAKSSRAFGTPEESVTPRKKEKLLAVSQHYLQNQDIQPDTWRIDFIAVEFQKGKLARIEQIENAVVEE